MKFVKQADTYHLVEDDAKPEPAKITLPDGTERRDGRPALRAKCGAFVHTGKLDQPIDNSDVCDVCTSVVPIANEPEVVAPETVDEALHETLPETLGELDTEPPL